MLKLFNLFTYEFDYFTSTYVFAWFAIKSFLYSFMIFSISYSLHTLKNIDILIIKYTIKHLLLWLCGSVLVWMLLDVTGIVNETDIAILIVCFSWDKIFQRLYNKSQDMGRDNIPDNI